MKDVMGRAGHKTMNAAIIYQHRTEHRGPAIAAAMQAFSEQALDGAPVL